MVTAGLEARYPILMTAPNSSHVFEPIVQVFARPDERLAGALPNEDAQSFVFDASNLFDRDKFSGFDRIEGGTRANIGARYTGTFDAGYTLRGVFGQSSGMPYVAWSMPSWKFVTRLYATTWPEP